MKIPRKVVIAGVASVLVAGMAGASAASLGTLGGSSLGASDTVVAACDSDGMTISYTTAFQSGTTQVTGVTFSGVDAGCDGLDATLTLRNNGTALGGSILAENIVVAGNSFTVSVPAGVAAGSVNALSLVIQG